MRALTIPNHRMLLFCLLIAFINCFIPLHSPDKIVYENDVIVKKAARQVASRFDAKNVREKLYEDFQTKYWYLETNLKRISIEDRKDLWNSDGRFKNYRMVTATWSAFVMFVEVYDDFVKRYDHYIFGLNDPVLELNLQKIIKTQKNFGVSDLALIREDRRLQKSHGIKVPK